MSRTIYFICFFIFSCFITAQNVEVSTQFGFNGVMDPGYFKPTHFGLGLNYHFDNQYGIMLDYGNDQFKYELDSNADAGISCNRISLQGVVNLLPLLNSTFSTFDKIQLSIHGGAGLSFIKSKVLIEKTDHIFNITMGFSPKYKVSDDLSVFLDFSSVINVSQHYQFTGELAYDKVVNSFTGLYYTTSFGLAYSFN